LDVVYYDLVYFRRVSEPYMMLLLAASRRGALYGLPVVCPTVLARLWGLAAFLAILAARPQASIEALSG
jgi:hypothetical protein